ncbi:hypothetical protein [Exiguobacterium sp.]|uniref:hypothetical protein n=1 Tax=Exiguobacterium sp. TaxID=44751 RepID=UPI0028AD3E40|nr:hypothetical protein [Exiguobacterium sp.]
MLRRKTQLHSELFALPRGGRRLFDMIASLRSLLDQSFRSTTYLLHRFVFGGRLKGKQYTGLGWDKGFKT